MKKQLIIMLLLTLCVLQIRGQNCTGYIQPPCEFVKDGSFEFFNTPCNAIIIQSSAISQNYGPCFWSLPNYPVNVGGNLGSSDYFNACVPVLPFGANSVNNIFTQFYTSVGANTGNGYSGFFTFINTTSNYREYVSQQLALPLVIGNNYTIKMNVRLAYISNNATSNIYGYLSMGMPTQTGEQPINTTSGQLINMTSTPIANKTGWVQLSINFIASNAYTHLTIGNFEIDANTILTTVPGPPSTIGFSYYFLDDVSIAPVSNFTVNSQSITQCLNTPQSVNLQVNPAATGAIYNWSSVPATSGLSSQTSPVVSVSPLVSTSYMVTTAPGGCANTAYATINVSSGFAIPLFAASQTTFCTVGQAFSINPDPNFLSLINGTQNFTLIPSNSTQSPVDALGNFPIVTTYQPGINTYTIIGEDANGCQAMTTLNVYVNTLVPTFTIQSSSCVGDNVTLATNADVQPGSGPGQIGAIPLNVDWGDGSGLMFYSSQPITYNNYSIVGTYVITVTGYLGGCPTTYTQSITINDCYCTNCPSGTIGGSGTLPPVVSGGQYCLNNNVTLTAANTIITGSEVKIGTGFKIIIPSGKVLSINNSHLYACNDMWQGIEVQNGGRVLFNNSLIEDAEEAVNISNNTQVSPNVLTATNTMFNKNYKGIVINNYNQAITTYPFNIKGCTFTSRSIPYSFGTNYATTANAVKAIAPTNAGLPLASEYINNATYPVSTIKAPHFSTLTYAGVELNYVGVTTYAGSLPTFYGFTLGSTAPQNTNIFDNIQIEVNAFNSNLNSINNIYQNTVAPYKSSGGFGIKAFCDVNFNGRVKASKVGNFDNKFIDCGSAIHITDYLQVEVENDLFRSSKSYPAITTLGLHGVYVNTNRFYDYKINGNRIYNLENGVLFSGTQGPYYNSVGTLISNGQFVNLMHIDGNTIQANLTSTQGNAFVKNAIIVQNVLIPNPVVNVNKIISASNNQINKVYRGIFFTNWFECNYKIFNNTILLVPDLYTPTNPEFGINMTKCNGLNNGNGIRLNTIFGYVSPTNQANEGIVYKNSNGNMVACNKTFNTYNGLRFNATNLNTNVFQNQMRNHKYGFVLSNNGVVGSGSPNSIGSLNMPADNEWIGTWNSTQYKTYTVNSDAQLSPMYIRSGPTNYNPTLSGTSAPLNTAKEYHTPTSLIVTTGVNTLVCSSLPAKLNGSNIVTANENDQLGVHLKENIQINLYPNPNNGEFTLTYDLKQIEGAKVTITDVTGKVVYSTEISNEFNTVQILTTDLKSGMYFIQLNNDDKLLWTNKFIIQH